MLRFVCVMSLVVAMSPARAENWPQFRGPTGMGMVSENGLPITWGGPDNENVLWKVALPGTTAKGKPDQNQSSPIVWGERLFVTTTFWPEGQPTSEFPEQHVTCYHVSDGRQLWDTKVPAGPWLLTDLRGGYSASTPACDGRHVYVVFGSAVLTALDHEGRIVWRHELPDFQSFDVAIASSPIVHAEKVLVLSDKNNQKSVLTAFDGQTGRIQWEQKRPQVSFAHSTPVMAVVRGQPQILVSASNALQGLSPQTGEVLWWAKTPGDVCSPVSANDLIYTDSGRGGPGVLVEPGGTGDVTSTNIKWTIPQIPEGLSSPVVVGEYLYRLHNPSVLKCIEWHSGKVAHTTRLDGVSVASSPVSTPEGQIYFASAGKTFVIKAGPPFSLIATNDLGDPSSASVAVARGKLFFKGKQHLFCIGKQP